MSLDRRDFLALAGLHVAAIALPGCAAFRPLIPDALNARITAVRPRVEAYFRPGDLDAIADIGRVWLTHVAPRRTGDEVLAAIGPTLDTLEALADATEEDALHALRAASTADFAALDLADADGWTLSLTEAALAAMLN